VLDPRHYAVGPRWEPIEGTPTMNGHGKSDRLVVPEKSPNKAGPNAAEVMEGSSRAKENLLEQNARRTQGRESAPSALERIRQAARRDKEQKFTTLMQLRRPRQQSRTLDVPLRVGRIMAAHSASPQSEAPAALDANANHRPTMLAVPTHLSSLALGAVLWRQNLRQEPDPVVPPVRICTGGRQQCRSLP
jgi:hypothetical protein